MTSRLEFWASAGLASALILATGASCTPDERSLGLGFRASTPGDAGSGNSAAGASDDAGAAGNAVDDNPSGQAGDAGGSAASSAGHGGTNPTTGGFGGTSAGASSGGAGGLGAMGGTLNGGGGNGGANTSGAFATGGCGDVDHDEIDDCSVNLVQNSNFDSNVTPWSSGEWNSSNAQGASASGSLLVLNDLPVVADTGFNLKAAEQCIQVTGDLTYRVAAQVLIPPGQGAGFGGINLWIFANDGCKGTYVTGLSPAMTQTTNSWTQLDARFKMPTAARSMVVRLAATRPFAQEKLKVLFDDILVKRQAP